MALRHSEKTPLWLIRTRNAIVDCYAAVAGLFAKKPRFNRHVDERGCVRIPEVFGPEYPCALLHLEALYRAHGSSFTRKLLYKAGRVHGEFRGLVSFEHRDYIPVFTMEFTLRRASIFLVFQDMRYVDSRPVRMFIERGPVDRQELELLLGAVADRIEYGLLPKAVRIEDGGASLRWLQAAATSTEPG